METLRVPLLNANEDELVVVAVHVEEGAAVRAGDLLFSLESTKAASEIEAPCSGYVRRIAVREDDRVAVGAPLCVITETADEPIGEAGPTGAGMGSSARATRRAMELAEAHGVDLGAIGVEGLIKERDVLAHLDAAGISLGGARDQEPRPEPLSGPNPIVIFGAGGHAKVIIDLIREGHRDLTPIAAVDDAPNAPRDVLGVPVIGGSSRLAELRAQGVVRAALGVGAVTHNATRVTLFERLIEHGFTVPNLIHPRASIEPSARMGTGNQVFAGAVIGSAASLGDNTIINSGVVVSHDCEIGSHTHLTPGAILAGGVRVGEGSVIGMGVTLYLGVRVGRGVTISNGVHVLADIEDGQVVRALDRATAGEKR